jgi:hypothetical protein
MKPFYLNLQHDAAGDTASGGASTPATTPNADSASVFSEPSTTVEPSTPSAAPSAANQSPSQQTATPQTPTSVLAPGSGGEPQGSPTRTPVAPVSTPQATLTPEQLATLASTAAQQTVSRMQAPSQGQQQTQQFTEADFNKTFRVPTLDAARFQAITGYAPDKPEQVAALHAWGQDLVREALAMGNYQLEQARSAVEGRLNPLLEAQQAQADRAIDNEFFTSNPPLKQVEGLVRQATTALRNEGARFDTKEQLFTAVKARVEGWLGGLTPHLATISPQGVAQSTPASGRTMASIPTGTQQSSFQRPATTAGDAKTIFG